MKGQQWSVGGFENFGSWTSFRGDTGSKPASISSKRPPAQDYGNRERMLPPDKYLNQGLWGQIWSPLLHLTVSLASLLIGINFYLSLPWSNSTARQAVQALCQSALLSQLNIYLNKRHLFPATLWSFAARIFPTQKTRMVLYKGNAAHVFQPRESFSRMGWWRLPVIKPTEKPHGRPTSGAQHGFSLGRCDATHLQSESYCSQQISTLLSWGPALSNSCYGYYTSAHL